jgi:hypothetical protein
MPRGGPGSEQVFGLCQPGIGSEIHGSKFAVLGLVDLEAIPDDKKHLSLGDEGNPIPLVQFLNTGKRTAGPSESEIRPPAMQKPVHKNTLTRQGQFCKIASKLNPFQQGIKNQPKNFKWALEQEPVLLRDLMRI